MQKTVELDWDEAKELADILTNTENPDEATEGEDIPEESKGFVRTITNGGKPEFDITITRAKPD